MGCAPPPSFSEGIIDRTGAQTMLYLTCTMITSVDLAHYGLSPAKNWVSVECGTRNSHIQLARIFHYYLHVPHAYIGIFIDRLLV